MQQTRVVAGMRILTEDQISKLGDNSLRLYRRKVKHRQRLAHAHAVYWCCTPRSSLCNTTGERDLTKDEIDDIKMYDYLSAACARELKRRQK